MMNTLSQCSPVELKNTPTLELLGPLRFSVEDHHSTIGANRVRTLLAVLGFNAQEVVSIDFLVEELFGEIPSKNPKNALQANIRRLRRFLEEATGLPGSRLVSTSANGYVLDLSPERVDAHRFASLAAKGAGLVRDRPLDAIRVLDEALRLWRGPALLDVSGGQHCRSQAGLLNNQRLTALEDFYGARLAVGADRSTVNGLEQLAAEHPERERISELLMLALYRTGRQREALATFHRVRAWLGKELGLEPGKSMRRIQAAILAQDPAIDSNPFWGLLP
jgi:DNA-binding SARP family transcriptional activator